MKKTTLEEATEIFKTNFEKWFQQQSTQTSGYEYEKSYVEMMQKVSRAVLEKSVENTGKGRKKNS
jgi:hypothetical protein